MKRLDGKGLWYYYWVLFLCLNELLRGKGMNLWNILVLLNQEGIFSFFFFIVVYKALDEKYHLAQFWHRGCLVFAGISTSSITHHVYPRWEPGGLSLWRVPACSPRRPGLLSPVPITGLRRRPPARGLLPAGTCPGPRQLGGQPWVGQGVPSARICTQGHSFMSGVDTSPAKGHHW